MEKPKRKMYKVTETEKIKPLFDNMQETIVWSCLDKCMGAIYADNLERPKSAMALMGDFCFFAGEPDYASYRENGLGAAALKDGILVSGASSYSFYKGGIEIEIDTRKDYRRRGLAAACGAALILECEKRGIYPSWDAQNKGSVALAEKLGYHFDREYCAYEVQ